MAARNIAAMAKIMVTGIPPETTYDQGRPVKELSSDDVLEAHRAARARLDDIGRRIEAGGRTPPLAFDRLDTTKRLGALEAEMKRRGLSAAAEPKTNAPGRRGAADKGREL